MITHAITLHAWWAWAVLHLGKRVENRSRPLPAKWVGVPVALHAGATMGDLEAVCHCLATARGCTGLCAARAIHCTKNDMTVTRSAVVGVVTFTGEAGEDDPWSLTGGGFHYWRIGTVRAVEPLPCRGALGFWRLPDHVRDLLATRATT